MKQFKATEHTKSAENMELNEISEKIIGAAIQVHTTLGPGLLESTYEACLKYELQKRGLKVLSQVGLPVIYDGMKIDLGYRLDLLVEDAVIVELKAVTTITPLHEAQLLSYLKLSGKPLGLLINFNVTLLKDGVKRRIN
jgi:GxxExxY protein